MDCKRCPGCSCIKPLTEYYRNAGRRQGVETYCKECTKQRAREHSRLRTSYSGWLRRRRRYGIDIETYDRMLAEQGGGCAICGATSPGRRANTGRVSERFHVDHDHQTGVVRGLLCHQCNMVLGFVDDDIK